MQKPVEACHRRVSRVLFPLFFVASAFVGASAVQQDRMGALWIAESGGILNVSADSGELRFEIPHHLGISSVAVNDISGDLWAYGNRRLYHYAREGQPLLEVEIPAPIHGGDPVDMVVDANSGNLWLAIKRELYRFDLAGGLQETLTLPREIVALAFDRFRSRLWVALEHELRIVDADGSLVTTVKLAAADRIGDLAYDRARDAVWANLSDRLRRYDHSGSVLFEATGAFSGAVVSDGAGGVWLARDRELIHLDELGVPNVTTAPFSSSVDQHVVDLVADPQDASVWVASQWRVRHYAVDGELLGELSTAPGDGVIRRLHRASLYVDIEPPEIRITAPASGVLLNDNLPRIELEYFDLGVGVDEKTLALTINGQTMTVTCTATASRASCTLAVALPEGPVRLGATVSDHAGNVSEAAETELVIDTTPPAVTLDHPPEGFITNQPLLSIRGGVNEPARVLINAHPVALHLDGSFRFDATLGEGGNTFSLSATDNAGNRSARSFAVTLDTVAPAAPNQDLIAIAEPSDGRVVVTGGANSVEPASTVRILNRRTGKAVTAVASADGSFQVAIEAEPGDELSIVVLDAAANVSNELRSQVPAGLSVALEEPLDGATIQHESVLVIGSYKGPLNAAITVNGKPARITSDGGKASFYATVPLQPGQNAMTVAAALQSGKSVTKTVTVNRAPGLFTVKLSPQDGILPLLARLSVTGDLSFYDFILVDFDGNGTTDAGGGGGSQSGFRTGFTYSAPGIYRPRVQVFRYSSSSGRYELFYQQTLAVAVFDPARLEQHLDLVLRSVWKGVNAALVAGDVPGALSGLSSDSRAVYGEVFQSLLPHLPDILDDFTDIEPLAISDNYADYAVMNVRDGKSRVHIINFVQGADGIWRIDSM